MAMRAQRPFLAEGGKEWPATLDVPALTAAGWRPTPFREFIVKVHSRCDLACDYCYVYEMADQTWRSRPVRMSPRIADRVAARVAEHVRSHGLTAIRVVLHGGEPLLAGPATIRRLVDVLRAEVGPAARTDVVVQTNAVRLTEDYLRLFDELGVRVGVSLDGTAEAHDRHRRRADGGGSHASVRAALERLTSPRHRHLFAGLLCAVDLRNDPLDTYEALTEFRPPVVDLLLPHGNWDAPPPGRGPDRSATPYGDWLVAVFDRWYREPRQRTRVRLFGEILHLLFGGASTSEAIGLSPVGVLVIETDGSVEQSDVLKSAYHGAPHTGLHVDRDPFDAALSLPAVVARQLGAGALSATCRACPVHRVCGAGLYAHRYRSGTGFANPSVYCPDLFRLVTHVKRTVEADLAVRLGRP
ncbi:radical SAM protein [Streptosporangium pseudovulgare]|uniref:Radical SAM protein n=2 Tax=Streptosporangium pseudovulgare TaxID=35765 RepID=A0ABQ2R3E3_9ACTN|nr:radical SAM protein [Streptosporangium pseudovulgare]